MAERMNITGIPQRTADQFRLLCQFSGMSHGEGLDFLMRAYIHAYATEYDALVLRGERLRQVMSGDE
jgi:hypothetical protein